MSLPPRKKVKCHKCKRVFETNVRGDLGAINIQRGGHFVIKAKCPHCGTEGDYARDELF